LFDLDFTLCKRCWLPESVLTDAFEAVGVTPYVTAADMFAAAGEAGTAENDVEFYTLCLEAAARRVGVTPKRAAAVARSYHDAIDYADVEFREGAKKVLRAIDTPIGLVTNGSEKTQRAKLAALGITDAFDTLVFADPENGVKPDPYPFERALSALDVTPDSAVHIGDSPRADVAGANAMGIRSIWLPTNGANAGSDDPAPDH